jgi:hypothetical protein
MENKYQYIYLNNHSNKFHNIWNNRIIDIIPKSYEEKIYNIFEKCKDNKLKDNSNVYLTPLSTLPSYKLKNYISENKLNVTITRKSNIIDTLIVNEELIKSCYFNCYNNYQHKAELWHIIPYDLLQNNYKSFIEPKGSGSCIFEYNPHAGGENYTLPTDGFIIKHSDIQNNSKLKDLLNCPSIEGYIINKSHGNKKAYDSIDLFNNLVNLVEVKKLDLILDTTLNSEINKELIIDLDVFKTLYSMLSSTDDSNYSVARELIANCEFETSKPYILFLANQFSEIRNKSNNKNYHNTHSQLKKYSKYYNNCENYANFIKDTVAVYPEYKQILCDCLTVHLNNLFKSDLIKTIHSI